jgi:hypothetical protein
MQKLPGRLIKENKYFGMCFFQMITIIFIIFVETLTILDLYNTYIECSIQYIYICNIVNSLQNIRKLITVI